MINTLILNPLPVPDSSELAAVGGSGSEEDVEIAGAPMPISYADLKDYQVQESSLCFARRLHICSGL